MSSKSITLRINYPEGRSRVNVSLEGTVKDLRDEVAKAVRFFNHSVCVFETSNVIVVRRIYRCTHTHTHTHTNLSYMPLNSNIT